MSWQKIFIPSRVAKLVTTEASNRSCNAPNSDLRRQVFVDLLYNIGVLDNHFQRDNISGCMDAFVRPGASYKGRLFRIASISLRNCAGFNERSEEVALNRLLCGASVLLSIKSQSRHVTVHSHLHAFVSRTGIPNEYSDFAFWLSLILRDFVFGERLGKH